MMSLFMRLFGSRVAHKAMQNHSQNGGLLDVKFGFALLRDRRVPLLSKLLALGIGFALMYAIVALELPFETVLAALLPLFGIAFDFALDGMEMVAGPALLACLLLPHMAPKPIVQQIRAERTKFGVGPVIDIAEAEPEAQTPYYATPRETNRLVASRR